MGQKVHPSGFRVGITKKHQSQWFARFNKNKYSQTVFEDRMIRDTLHKLFPELLNPISKNETKRDQNAKVKKSQITQIKIERNIVPYEIGIQIHAENCKLLKSAIKNLQVKREIIVKLQKTRQYLINLKTKLDNLTNNPSDIKLKNIASSSSSFETEKEGVFEGNNNLENSIKKHDSTKLSKIKSLRKKLSKIKASNSTISSSGRSSLLRKKAVKGKIGFGSKQMNLVSKRSLSKLFKIKLLRAKLSKLIQIKTKRKLQTLDSNNLNKQKIKSLKSKKRISPSALKGFSKGKRKSNLGAKLTKRQLKRQIIFKKRLQLRKFIRLRDRLLISKGLVIQKKGRKIVKKLSLSPTPKFLKDFSLNPKVYLLPVQKIEKILSTKKNINKKSIDNVTEIVNQTLGNNSLKKGLTVSKFKTNIFNSRLQKKVVTMYVEQMKRKFLPHLNDLFIQYTNQKTQKNILTLGYLKKWDFKLRAKSLKTKSIEKLTQLIQNLREKFVMKLNALRKEFIAFGSFSCNSSEIIGLFQLYNFVINLKDLVHDLKRNLKHNIKTRLAISKMSSSGTLTSITSKEPISSNENIIRPNKLRVIDSEAANALLPQKIFRKKLDNISNECRKIKFIEYLKDLVKKHRTDNVYLYLASLSESRKKLKEIKNELKENLDFYLPGTNSLKNLIETRKNESSSSDNITLVDSKINEQVNKVLLKLAKKHPFDKTFSECKLEELERRKTMWLKNLQLTPKISIKFFSVNPKSLNQKASVVAESVVDALEKRKAFRKVIKSTKEKLMRNPEIKGVKIQVAGRLNGAEIARTEWVRAGRVPLQTLRANLDYSYRTANTIYGIIGIKVWIFKGFTKLISK
jgi:ribosomal protein S3